MPPPLLETVALTCLAWTLVVIFVQAVGIGAIFRHFSHRPRPAVSPKLGQDAPHVTIIRPVKGLDPHLYDCIASTFRQDYPIDKFSIRLCVEDEADAAYPLLQKLVSHFPNVDAQVLLESCDPALPPGTSNELGPNPKIRNISRAYREAKGDIIWIIDCNVWVANGVVGRMVDKLMGYTSAKLPARPYKFVHQMPLVVDVVDSAPMGSSASRRPSWTNSDTASTSGFSNDTPPASDGFAWMRRNGGGRLDEMFMSTSHVKFYSAINAVGIAPCIVGKSNMFRKSHLDQATSASRRQPKPSRPSAHHLTGIDYFSYNICEDHLIGDLLWRSQFPGYLNHGIVWGDLVTQPMSAMSIGAYAARRTRWLRARKFTVPVATLVEPGVESFLCCAYFSFALTTIPWFHLQLGIPQTWRAMAAIWLAAVATWMSVDLATYRFIQSGHSVEVRDDTPAFARGTGDPGGHPRRPFSQWFLAWIGRELLALPIWTWAVLLGTTVKWRGQTFLVRFDATVVDLSDRGPLSGLRTPEPERERQSSKDRLD